MCRIVHLTSAHPRSDTRIFIKQCRTLAAHGYDVKLVVADDKGDAHIDGVTIADVGRLPGRLNRIIKTTRRVFDKAVALDADIYQLHDPELLPIGVALKRRGKKVIFDSHEDVPRQLLSKPYLGPLSGRVLSAAFSLAQRYTCSRFDAIITATPFIRETFLNVNQRTVDVNNFPMVGELDAALPWEQKQDEICYVGGISEIRGIRELVHAGQFLRTAARLNLVGKFSETALEDQVKAQPGWARVNQLGFLDRAAVRDVMQRSVAGVVTFHPIDYLVKNPDVARSMGENGRRAVLTKYNWSVQAKKLTDFYGDISNARQTVAAV